MLNLVALIIGLLEDLVKIIKTFFLLKILLYLMKILAHSFWIKLVEALDWMGWDLVDAELSFTPNLQSKGVGRENF